MRILVHPALVLLLALPLVLPACLVAAVAVGAAAGAGAVIYTAEDTVAAEVPLMPGEAHMIARRTLAEMGRLDLTREEVELGMRRRIAEGKVGSTRITVTITPGPAAARVSVKGRRGLLPDREGAEMVLARIQKKVAARR
jgi:hypothetical protein